MRLGLFTTVVADYDLDQLIALAKKLGVETLEFSSLIGRGLRHFDPVTLLESHLERERFLDILRRNDISISQLNCSCNPVSPTPGEEEKCKENFLHTFRLAEKLGVDTVASFSGCPAGGPADQTPNWITCPWPTQYSEMLRWQWEEKLIPFWTWAAQEGEKFGVKHLAIEMHPGFCVYNPETLLKLCKAVGPAIGANFDPSHLIWQGIDIPAAIETLKGAIWHVHAKDTYVNERIKQVNGMIDVKPYKSMEERSWSFRTVGYGLSQEKWKQTISSLRMVGYDGVLSIEHEDMLMSKQEGLEKAAVFLKPLLMTDSPEPMWWA